jgi:hypothetical protein
MKVTYYYTALASRTIVLPDNATDDDIRKSLPSIDGLKALWQPDSDERITVERNENLSTVEYY